MAVAIESFVVGGDSNGTLITTTTWAAQTFTLGTTGTNLDYKISSVDVLVLNDTSTPTGTITLEIYATDVGGIPTGSPLSTGTISAYGCALLCLKDYRPVVDSTSSGTFSHSPEEKENSGISKVMGP